MSEGFVVMSRWGHKLHKVGCPCGVCISKRKKHHVSKQKAPEIDEEMSSTTMVTSRQTNPVEGETAPTDAACNSPMLAQSTPPDGQPEDLAASAVNGAPALTITPATDAKPRTADTRLSRAGKPLPKTRFSMELAALGTPDLPLNKTRVPRQAATAAKAAIKKDLLMQNSRPGASSVPPKGTSLPATKPVSDIATKPTASKLQKALHPASKAKRRSNRISRDDEVSAQPPAGPIDDEIPPAASALDASDAASDDIGSDTAAAATTVVTAGAADDAAPLASSAPGASPQRSAKTSPHSRQSPSTFHHDDTVQDAVQSAELPDGSSDACEAEGQDPALPGSPPRLPLVPPPAVPAPELSLVEQFAQEVRSKAKWGPAVDVNVRGLMASGVMAGQPVHIQLKHKDPVYLQGVIQATGLVRCAQYEGGPVNHECSLSEYEKLGYSKERRPGENVHLTNFSLALKDFCALVNDIGEKARNRCLHCKQGSGLVRCKGCSVAAHPTCVGLVSRQQQANWFCEECKTSGQDKLPQRPQDLQGRSRAPPQRPPPRPHSAAAAAPSHPVLTHSKPNTGRVHMAVPVSGMTPARRERNGNKHKRLFMGGPGGLTDGEPVEYRTAQQGVLQKGVIFIKPGLDAQAGILCECCNQVVSCSKFEAHAGQGSRRAPYDNIFTAEGITLRARAAMLPPLLEGDVSVMSVRGPRRVSHSRSKGNAVHHSGQLGGIVDGCRDVIHDLDHDAGGCNICGRPDFALGAFCDRTMILCDQCECEFHVGCLRKAARCDLSQLPTGDWFCSEDCNGIWRALNGRVAAGPRLLDTPDYSLQLMRGRDTSGTADAEATNNAIDTAQQVLQESFDPIIDKATKENLLLLMTKAEVKGEYDYRGMYTALLTHQGRAVCAAVFRAFGAQLAEVPLVATKADARRQGHCRVLMSAFEVLLKEAGVRTMCLPAAYSTVHTWIQGFGLQPMPDDDLDAACKDLRLLIFPGTQVLHKQLLPPLPPKQGPLMTPPWAEEPAAVPADGQTAVDPSSEPQQALDAEGMTVTPPLPVLEAKAEASAAATAVEAPPSDMLLPVHTQPEQGPVPSAVVARPEAADDTAVTDARSDSAAAVEASGDMAVGEAPTIASAQDQAVFQDSPGGSPAAAPVETAPVLLSPAEDHDMLAHVGPGLPLAEVASQGVGAFSAPGVDVQAAPPPMHLEHKPGTFTREDDDNGKTEEASAAMQDPFVQEVVAPGENQEPPAPSSWQQNNPATQPSHQRSDQPLLLPSAAAHHVQFSYASPDASSDADPSLVSGLPHVAHEDPFMHKALAQHAASSTMSQPWTAHHTEPAAAGANATVAAPVSQAPHHQSHGSTASQQGFAIDAELPGHQQLHGAAVQPLASSHDLDAMLPVGMVAPQAPAVPSSAHPNGQALSSQQPQALGQNGLADELFGWEQQVLAQPLEESALEKAGEQQAMAMAESNGWHVQEPGSNSAQPQGTIAYAGVAVPQCSEIQELVQSSTAQGGSHELLAPGAQSQEVHVAQHPSQTNALPGQLVSQSAEPLFVGRKRHLGDDDDGYGAPDSIVAKKPCLAVSGSV